MKKIYQTPQSKVVILHAAMSLLAGSIRINSTDDAVDAGSAASRDHEDLWDD